MSNIEKVERLRNLLPNISDNDACVLLGIKIEDLIKERSEKSINEIFKNFSSK